MPNYDALNAAMLDFWGDEVTFQPGTLDETVMAIIDQETYPGDNGMMVHETTISVTPDARFQNNTRWDVGGVTYRQQGPAVPDGSGLDQLALVRVS
nr:hypothetical protein 19 [Pseudomonadaceae bacterium]